MKNYLVKDWMQTNVITADAKTPMLEAHKLMRQHKIRRMPVVKRDRTLIGILTRSDVRQAEPSDATTLNVWEMHYLLAQLQVKDIMTKNVTTVGPEDTVRQAASLMHTNKIGALPVVDDRNRVVGILTESDIFRVLIAWFDENREREAGL